MAGFGAKVKLSVDRSSEAKKQFNEQINGLVNQIKISNKFVVLQKDMDRVRDSAQTMLNKSPIKITSIDCSQAVKKLKTDLQNVINSLSIKNGVTISGLVDPTGADTMATKIDNITDAAARGQAEVNRFNAQMSVLKDTMSALSSSYKTVLPGGKNFVGDTAQLNEITQRYVALRQKIEEVNKAKESGNYASQKQLEELQNESVAIQRVIAQIEQERIAREKEAAETNKANKAAQQSADKRYDQIVKVNNLLKQTRASLEKWTAAKNGSSSEFYRGLESEVDNLEILKRTLESSTEAVDDFDDRFKKSKANISKYSEGIAEAGENTKTFSDRVGGLASKFASWLTVSQIIMRVYEALKEMVKVVSEVDAAMTELRKVTDETESTYSRFLDTAAVRAKNIGATISDTVNATADFARLGYDIADASVLADAAIIYKNVGDGIKDINEASESIISTMQAFGIEASNVMTIVDKFNIVGNNFAISSTGVGEALLNSASALHAAGNTLDESIALITAANEVIQNPEKVGTAMKTLSMYIRAAKTEAEEAGIATDGMANSVSELREEILALTGNKVDIMIDDDTFKSTVDIIRELSMVWGDLSDITRTNITELIGGGVRNANVISALINNFETVEEVLATTADSAGSALAENEKYLDSIAGKVSKFKATFQDLSTNLIDSEFVKQIVDFGTGLLNLLNAVAKVIDAIGGLNTVLIGTAGILAAIKLDSIITLFSKTLPAAIVKLISPLATVITNFGKLRTVLKAFNSGTVLAMPGVSKLDAALKALGISASSVQLAIGALTVVITAAIAIYQRHQQKLQEQRDAAIEAANALGETSNSVEEYKSKIIELRTAIDSGNLSEKEAYNKRQELLTIQKSLVEMFGKEAEGIDLVTASIDSQIDAIDRLSESKWTAYKQENTAAIRDAVDLFTDFKPSMLDLWNSPIGGGFTIEVPSSGELWDAIEDLNLDMVPANFHDKLKEKLLAAGIGIKIPVAGITGDFVSDLDVDSIYDALDVYQELYDITESLGKEFFGVDYLDYVGSALEGYSAQIKSINAEIKESEVVFDTYVEGLLNYEAEYSNVWGKILSAQKEYNDAVLNDDSSAAAAAIEKMRDAEEAFLSSGWDNEAVNLYVSEFFDEWNTSSKNYNFEVEIKTKLADSNDELGNEIKNALKAFEGENGVVDVYRILNFEANTDNVNIDSFKKNLEYELKELERGGSVELLVRPQVDSSELAKVGWEISDGIATVFSSTFSNEDGTIAANFTPILVDPITGKTSYLTEDELTAYAESVIAGVRKDDLNIQIGGFFNGENAIAEAEEAAVKIHELHELYYMSESELSDYLNEESDAYSKLKEVANEYGMEIEDLCNILLKLGYVQDTSLGGSADVYKAKLKALTEVMSELQSAYKALDSAEKDMATGQGLTAETIAALAAAEENYLDFLYEENGVVMLNTEAWKENANAKMQLEMLEIEKEIASLEEENEILADKNKLLQDNIDLLREQMSVYGYNEHHEESIEAMTGAIEVNNATIAENTNLIRENQGLLAIYGSIYGDLAEDLSVYQAVLENFSNVAGVIDNVATSYAGLANLQNAVANGFTFSLDKILEYAKAYPEILNSATVTADGQLALNEAVVNSFIAGKKAELDAQIDAEIAKLEADKSVLEAKKEFAQAQLEIAKAVGNGEGAITKEIAEYRINAGNAIAQAMIQNGMDEAEAFRLAAAAMSQNAQEFNRVAYDVCTDIDGNFDQAAYNMAMNMYNNAQSMQYSIAAIAQQAHETAIAIQAMSSGVVAGSSTAIGGGATGVEGGGIALTLTEGSFDGTNYTYTAKEVGLDDFISQIELEIDDYENAIANINGQIAVLEALRDTPFESFKNLVDNASSIVGEKTNDKIEKEQKEAEKAAKEEKEKAKLVEEYIAAIDEYYEALKVLEEVQKRRASLEKKLSHTEDLSEKIFLSSGLIDIYGEEMQAERNLMSAKQATIAANAGALRGLGFEVSYDPATNELYIKNLEHLNDLTAKSAGEYDTLQEATNALRKETEELIDTTEQLNQDNIQSAENIEDLGYEILETKNNIIDYIEEIYSKQIESYRKIIDLRKELIQSAKDEYDYEADIAEKVKEVAELQARIDQLALDDSRSAQAERNSLMQELAEKQQELADTQGDHATDSQLEALDKMADDYETQRNEEIETMRGTVTQSEELWNAFYQTILGKNVTVGTSIDENIANAWIRAAQAVNGYGVAMSNLSTGGVVVNSIPKYHTGGVVDEANVGKNETLALLEKGEIVLNDGKQQALYKIINFQEELSKRLGALIGNLTLPDLSGGLRSMVGDLANNITSGSQGLVFNPQIRVEINHNGAMSDTDAKSYGEKIADTAIEKLYGAFERRGINSTRAARLKP